jgi:hypothetical protein
MKVLVLELRPTQFAVGMAEVKHRIEKISGLEHGQLHDYVHEHKVPVVLGPKGRMYLVDHHHLVRACWEARHFEVPVHVVADLSKHSLHEFWKQMERSSWLHLYDQLGNGPHDPVHLPDSIRGVADDPYRSLAWLVRERGGFEKSAVPFSEFSWAQYFRTALKAHPAFDSIDEALTEALRVSHLPAAKHLPGYLPPKA